MPVPVISTRMLLLGNTLPLILYTAFKLTLHTLAWIKTKNSTPDLRVIAVLLCVWK